MRHLRSTAGFRGYRGVLSRTVVAACLLAAVLVSAVSAYSPLRKDAWYPLLQRTLTVDGGQARDGVGTAIASLPNFTGDGRTSIAVGAPNFNPGGRSGGGAVLITPAAAAQRLELTPSTTAGTFIA